MVKPVIAIPDIKMIRVQILVISAECFAGLAD